MQPGSDDEPEWDESGRTDLVAGRIGRCRLAVPCGPHR